MIDPLRELSAGASAGNSVIFYVANALGYDKTNGKGENMDFEDFKEELIKQFPIRHTKILPLKKPIESVDDMHSLGCWTAIDLFKFSKEHQHDTPALFLLPFDRTLITERFLTFIKRGEKADLVIDETEGSRYGALHIICEFSSDLSKDMMAPIVKGLLTDLNAPYYSFISETWVVKQKKPYNRELDGRVSEHPDKEEKLIVCTSDPTQNIMTMKDIADDKLTGDGDYQKTKADISVGRFSNFFRDDTEHTRH